MYNILSGDSITRPGNYSQDDPSLLVDLAVPRNTSFFILNGTVSPWGQFGSVSASPRPDFWAVTRFTPSDGGGWYDYKGWFSTLKSNPSNTSDSITNEVLYYAPLDPSVEYHLKVQIWGNSPGLHSITYFSGLL